MTFEFFFFTVWKDRMVDGFPLWKTTLKEQQVIQLLYFEMCLMKKHVVFLKALVTILGLIVLDFLEIASHSLDIVMI